MENWGVFRFLGYILLCGLLLCGTSMAGEQSIGKINPGFEGSQMNWIDVDGTFLLSDSKRFGFGFSPTSSDVTKFLLDIKHMKSRRTIWTANRGALVDNNSVFVFDKDGNVNLKKGDEIVWSTDTGDKGVATMELQDTGNLVLLGNDSSIIWESFRHPTDTLISNQAFVEGVKLVSDVAADNLTFALEIKSGDAILSAAYQNPQPYWSLANEHRKTVNKNGVISQAFLEANSWKFYDKDKVLIWQFVFSVDIDVNATWVAVLGKDGFISFYNLRDEGPADTSPTKIPSNSCSTPEPCGSYFICSGDKKCQCPSALNSFPNCKPGISSLCNGSIIDTELVDAGDDLGYFALEFLPTTSDKDLDGCKNSCLQNCSCLALFYQNSSAKCFHLDSVGSFQGSDAHSGFISYIKVSSDGESNASHGKDKGSNNHIIVIIIVVFTVLVILSLLYVGFRIYKRKKHLPEPHCESSEEDNFLETISGMPVRFTYKDLQTATNNFSAKLGHGGFGSVYQGVLPDGTRLAVKKLEGIGQGKKEFRAEVSIIGSIHHLHLVRLRGFCAEGTHRLLAYEFMANNSLDKWIFKKDTEELLDWDTRYNIAVGTAKGLAYLHEDCDVKIVHCDIKPENVLLDENFQAKVSDFGLAKLMTREQSHVFTTMRGTRGYLAPEWITNYAISERSDVYSYGMLLLEIIGGRKNYDPNEGSEKSHFPSYAFKMLEDGKLHDILDSRLNRNDSDERVLIASKVALWCIQEDVHMRPFMGKVVQMLEGLCDVPTPPTSSILGSRLYASFLKSISEEGTSSGPSDCNSDAHLSAVRLSGPR